ncbi:GDSL esterase/lipase APG-like [Lolium rigidum]|uniref:GDSL esterase/lipase APG-like n=1 Tax=Lolium rigidum TaxID=89674 RepID=UPI001F5E1E9D|nr:GDSL esterase/lipase APG-like [Lolium rigidum]
MKVRCILLLAVFLVARPMADCTKGSVPAIMFFGDSLVDVGNNDYIHTIVKANLPPYGRDFEGNVATGRFCNGMLLSDMIGENLGFSISPPAYLSPQAAGTNLLNGANFASAGSGYYDPTSLMYGLIPLSQQLKNFKEYISKLVAVAGSSQAQSIISDSLYILSSGSNDFAFNYYINPLLYKTVTTDDFADLLVGISIRTVTQLYGMGARRIGVFSVPPFGCFPLAITVFGFGSSKCVPGLNDDALRLNKKLNTAIDLLSKQLHDLKIEFLDIYTPVYILSTFPGSQGFTETRRACCGTGTVESTILLCNPKSIGTCPNATTYVYWDVLHPSEAANKVIVDSFAQSINKLVI